ncbi:hypothetical protein NSTC731_00373 [Nostoc sp. DSM 114167]
MYLICKNPFVVKNHFEVGCLLIEMSRLIENLYD